MLNYGTFLASSHWKRNSSLAIPSYPVAALTTCVTGEQSQAFHDDSQWGDHPP